MEVSVNNQAFVFLCFILGGFAIGFFYDFLKVLIEVLDYNKIITVILDLFFWAISAMFIFMLVFITNNGELRWYEFLGALLGIILYNMLLGRIIKNILYSIYELIVSIACGLFKLFMWPIAKIYKLIMKPFGFIKRTILLKHKYTRRKIKNIDNKLYIFTKRIGMLVKKF